MRAWVAADLNLPVADGERVDPASALHELLVDVGALGGLERALLTLGAKGRLRDLHVLVPHSPFGSKAELDLLGERDVQRVSLGGCPVLAFLGRRRHQLDLAPSGPARAGARECDCAFGRGPCSFLRQPAIARESPGAVDEDADADAFGLAVRDRLDLAVLRSHVLGPARHRARVRVAGSAGRRRVDRLSTKFAHEPRVP